MFEHAAIHLHAHLCMYVCMHVCVLVHARLISLTEDRYMCMGGSGGREAYIMLNDDWNTKQ